MSKEKKEVRNHLKRCVIVNGLIKCKIKLLNLQYFDAQGHKLILQSVHEGVMFDCSECDYQGTTKKNLKSHIQFVHQGGIGMYNHDQ